MTQWLAQTQTSAIERWVPGSIGMLIFGSIGTYMLWMIVQSWQSRSWKESAGRIIGCRMERVRQRAGWGARTYVTYEYVVDATTLRASQIRFGDGLNINIGDAKRDAERYPTGKSVAVYYDPAKPQRATLERKAAFLAYLFFALALCAVATIAYGVATGT